MVAWRLYGLYAIVRALCRIFDVVDPMECLVVSDVILGMRVIGRSSIRYCACAFVDTVPTATL